MQLNPAETVCSRPAGTSSAIQMLPSILVAVALLMLFAPSSHYRYDGSSSESYKEWSIGGGAAQWLSVSRHGTGPQNATNWEPLQFELHANWLAPALLLLLIVVNIIRHRTMSRQGLTLGAALDFQLQRAAVQMPHLPAFLSQLPRQLLNAIVIATAAGLVFNLFMPAQVHYTIESLDPARAEQLVERLEPALIEAFPGFSIRLVNQEQASSNVVIEGRRYLFTLNDQLSTMIGETGLTAGTGHTVRLSGHPATLPVILTTGALVLLMGWRRTLGNKHKPNATG